MQSDWLRKNTESPLNIWVVGRSEKFVRATHAAFPQSTIRVISWRALDPASCSGPKPDLLVVCGYDYSTYLCSGSSCIERNVIKPANWITKMAGSNVPVIYVTTADGKVGKTWSRYRYAKTRLACELKNRAVNVRVTKFPTILDEQGNVDVHGGIISRWIFELAVLLRMVQVVPFSDLAVALAQSASANTPNWDVAELKPRFLSIPRTNFADRVLRMLCG
ncbi:hypothetical protein C7401_127110 [Paraburkholderia unamae]|uniref:hypothetical protein n=1 Tax=Paraburkholderia unamae TaxID=219649 RepID=UPI000DC1FD4D|nr:hypothetical protein [Paraburkholderia unamae]RAR53644.1 hypothetical protein C7401_127110 [Paraburkholderia unamae]